MRKFTLAHFFGLKTYFKNLDDQKLLVAYKLLHDSLFLALFTLLASMIFEGILPGIITAHIGFSKIIIGVFINLFLIKSLAGKIPSAKTAPSVRLKKSELAILITIILIGLLLLFGVQSKISSLLNLFIVFCFAACGYLLFEMFFHDKDSTF